ncbi:MAG: Nif11-like leader peptide family RiPP precursor [Ruminiclostridium sp.]|nr:Nif11-like leader peptide family RiPP precursor [Ruminiclostridium sp.]
MSKETAKNLITELQTNKELKAKVEGITDPAELVKKAVEAGYDVTVDELIEAEKEFRKETAEKNDVQAKKLSVDELDAVAGGSVWRDEEASDGHELGCIICYHDYNYQKETGEWCKEKHYCLSNNQIQEQHSQCGYNIY